MEDLPQRRRPPHFPPVERFNAPTIIYLTVCIQGRKPILTQRDVHVLLAEAWREAAEWWVGRYVLMPDHVHLFCAPGRADPFSLGKWVQFWKSRTSRRWPRLSEQPVWQKSFWDTQLRSSESYEEK
jgi:REP element-mobilizing transposase RayT